MWHRRRSGASQRCSSERNDDFSVWIGREQRSADRLDEGLAARWLAPSILPFPPSRIMPQGIHFALCTPDAPTAMLGEDGHPARDDKRREFPPPRAAATPDVGLVADEVSLADWPSARLWSAGSTVVSVSEKEADRAASAFVDVEHVTRPKRHDRGDPRPRRWSIARRPRPLRPLAPPPPGESHFIPAAGRPPRSVARFSACCSVTAALTFNTHRKKKKSITTHPMPNEIERYTRASVVHGPLTASLLLQTGSSRAW